MSLRDVLIVSGGLAAGLYVFRPLLRLERRALRDPLKSLLRQACHAEMLALLRRSELTWEEAEERFWRCREFVSGGHAMHFLMGDLYAALAADPTSGFSVQWKAGWTARLDRTLLIGAHIDAPKWPRRVIVRRDLRARMAHIGAAVNEYNVVAAGLRLEALTRPLSRPQTDQEPNLMEIANRASVVGQLTLLALEQLGDPPWMPPRDSRAVGPAHLAGPKLEFECDCPCHLGGKVIHVVPCCSSQARK